MQTAHILPIRYPSVNQVTYNYTKDDVIVIDDPNIIKSTIYDLLFMSSNNYVLIYYNGKLFICEKEKDTYSRRQINYHPLMHLVMQ